MADTTERRQFGADDPVVAAAQAIDAALDAAEQAFTAGESAQGLALLEAVDASVDSLLELLGQVDPDEPNGEQDAPPASTTTNSFASANWDLELRAKYNAEQLRAMAKSGQAMPDGGYPIGDREDLQNAIRAVGRGSGSHDDIRRHIMKRARALKLTDLLPDNWKPDGSMRSDASAERRVLSGHVELRSSEDGKFGLVGYASVTGTPYPVKGGRSNGGWDEIVAPGAFKRSISTPGRKVPLLINHDSESAAGIPLAAAPGTLTLEEDELGLRWEAPDLDISNPTVAALRSAVARGDIDSCSFAFNAKEQNWNNTRTERRLDAVELIDVSMVVHPANPAAMFVGRSSTNEFEETAASGVSLSYAAAVAASLRLKRIPA